MAVVRCYSYFSCQPTLAAQVYVCIPVDSDPCKFLMKASASSPLIDVVCSAGDSVYRLDCDFSPNMLLMSTQMCIDKPELVCLCKDEVECEPDTS